MTLEAQDVARENVLTFFDAENACRSKPAIVLWNAKVNCNIANFIAALKLQSEPLAETT